MEETTSKAGTPNRTVVILLGVIVVLLLGAIGYLVFSNGAGTEKPASTASGTGSTGSQPSGMGTGTGTAAPFDPATATVVAKGQTPEQHVKEYFDAVVAADYAKAFKLLPTAKQTEYGSETAFADQLKGYGVTGYTIDSVVEKDGETQVTASATMPGGNFQYLWTFVKDGDKWLVKSRTLPGMN